MEKKKTPIYIFGHKNPDTDSTCAAVAYANLKNIVDPDNQYIPALLGPISAEASFVLQTFGQNTPVIMKDLKPKVSDLNLTDIFCAHETDSIKRVLEAIITVNGRSLPVVDINERLIGIISISDIIPFLLESHKKDYLNEVSIPFDNLISVLDLKTIRGKVEVDVFNGGIYIFNDIINFDRSYEKDLVICNRAELYEESIFGLKPGFILVVDMDDDMVIDWNGEYNGAIFTSPKNTYEVVQGIGQAFPISNIVQKNRLQYFVTYETLEDVMKNMSSSKFRRFPVVDENGFIQGMLSRSNLMEVIKHRVILVDHNEKGQSITGIESLHIMEVIDHHRVADVQTMGPLYFRVEPVGSTNTIVAKMYEENEVPISREMAGVMLSGILSDTLVFKSPTCTERDKRTAEKLAVIAEVPLINYGIHLIRQGECLLDVAPDKLISTDMKRFTFGTYQVAVAQANISDFDSFYTIYQEVKQAMVERCQKDGLDLFVLMATSLVLGGTELIVVGEARWIAESAYKMEKGEDSIFLNDVFSRKKQVVPKLMEGAKL